MGTGGVGGYYGALLARSGQDVTFIARGEHLRAIQKDGLRIKSVHGDFVVEKARAVEDPAEIGPVDLVLFTVKTYDLAAAAAAISPRTGSSHAPSCRASIATRSMNCTGTVSR